MDKGNKANKGAGNRVLPIVHTSTAERWAMSVESLMEELEVEIDDSTPETTDRDSVEAASDWLAGKTNTADLMAAGIRMGYPNGRFTNKKARIIHLVTKTFENLTEVENLRAE